MEDQKLNAVQARQIELDDKLEKKAQALRKRRSRAKGREDEELVKWEVSFDLERLSKGGGLIDIHEVAPFVDCQSTQEEFNTCRIFSHTLRRAKVDCPDIGPEETIDAFIRRCIDLWYRHKSPNGVQLFVGLKTLEFDDDLGFHHEQPYDFSGWQPWPDSDVTVDVASLPRIIGREPMQWEKDGFSSYGDWKDEQDEQERKKKNRELLDKYLASQPAPPTTPETGDGIPKLLYRAIITEH